MAGYNNYKSFVFYGQQVKCNYWIEVEQDIRLVGCRANNEIIERSAAGPSRPELAPGEMAARTPRRLGTKNPLSLQIEHDPFRDCFPSNTDRPSKMKRIGIRPLGQQLGRPCSSLVERCVVVNLISSLQKKRKERKMVWSTAVKANRYSFIFSRNTNSSGGTGLDTVVPFPRVSCRRWISFFPFIYLLIFPKEQPNHHDKNKTVDI